MQARPQEMRARLAEGDPTQLPASVAASLDPTADLAFRYSERVHQEDVQVPLVLGILGEPFFVLEQEAYG